MSNTQKFEWTEEILKAAKENTAPWGWLARDQADQRSTDICLAIRWALHEGGSSTKLISRLGADGQDYTHFTTATGYLTQAAYHTTIFRIAPDWVPEVLKKQRKAKAEAAWARLLDDIADSPFWVSWRTAEMCNQVKRQIREQQKVEAAFAEEKRKAQAECDFNRCMAALTYPSLTEWKWINLKDAKDAASGGKSYLLSAWPWRSIPVAVPPKYEDCAVKSLKGDWPRYKRESISHDQSVPHAPYDPDFVCFLDANKQRVEWPVQQSADATTRTPEPAYVRFFARKEGK